MEINERVYKYITENDTDLIIYRGDIGRNGYDRICDILDSKTKKSNIILILDTLGGDPNAAYRIARAIIHHYGAKNFKVAITSYCKSAGTLLCVGATELIFFDRGEMGPLDTQIIKQDEIAQRSSGLDILRGLSYLNSQAVETFKSYLFDLTGSMGISTKTASEIAANITKGLYTPIYEQIEPLRLGEMNAALQIAHEYGTRLNEKSEALKEDSLSKLIHAYPTHSFVIDRAEARTLFNNVSHPDNDLKHICDDLSWLPYGRHSPFVIDLTDIYKSPTLQGEYNDENRNEDCTE
ncbi:SDH family Clp fold serine proteinase [Oligella urethralis]|uniref:SDH family Clp fold serine proteinase n=1 Tax=Oligella urethralis TaxID=90245 RepID=UPI00068BBAF1|nr:hypothetical protein [Oligella urethralis]